MDKKELQERTKAFAIRILKMIEHLPKSTAGRVIANQICRCGTSVAANYRAACRARSREEFAAKIGIVEEEADESVFWLELIIQAEMLSTNRIQPLIQEAHELTAIMAASQKTARARRLSIGNRQSAIGNP